MPFPPPKPFIPIAPTIERILTEQCDGSARLVRGVTASAELFDVLGAGPL
jgi:hypothetical protein